jgi:hypothetical protein
MNARVWTGWVLCLVLTLSSASLAAEDIWSEPFAGVKYLHRTTTEPAWSIHMCFIDLTHPEIRLIATRQDERGEGDRGMSTIEWGQLKGVQVAINGGMGGRRDGNRLTGVAVPSGITMGDGQLWSDVRTQGAHENFGSFAEGGGLVRIIEPGLLGEPEPWMRNILIGTAVLVKEGKPNPDMTQGIRPGHINPRHPRTAVGLTKDGKTLILMVADGRQKHSVGMTGEEMQPLFMEFGAWTALNFDGGGSTCMYIEGKGVLNKPSDGRPRRVSTHLGVYAEKGPSLPRGQIKGHVREAGSGRPIAGAKVALAGSEQVDTTTPDGYFHLSQVPAGTPSLLITADGFKEARVATAVGSGQQLEVVAELER